MAINTAIPGSAYKIALTLPCINMFVTSYVEGTQAKVNDVDSFLAGTRLVGLIVTQFIFNSLWGGISQHKILWFYVSVHDAHIMNSLQSTHLSKQ